MAAQMIRPRSNKDVEAKPGSAHQIVLSIRRVLGYGGVTSGKFKYTRQVLSGMSQAFMAVHGKDSLRPRRKEALPDAAYGAMFRIPRGTVIGSMRVGGASFETLLDAVSLLDDTGMRKAEVVSQPADTFLKCMVWFDVNWFIQGREVARPSLEQLMSMTKHCYVLITPTNSKCDATGEVWGTHPMSIPFADHRSNGAFRLRARYIHLGIAERSDSERKAMPLFADSHGRALKADALDGQYRALLKHVLPHTWELYSLHSHRIRLACRLRRIGASDGRIQAMCRWSSVESLHIYARWDIHEYADWVRRSRKANATTLETTNIPVLGDEYGSAAAACAAQVNSNKKTKPPVTCPAEFEQFPVQNSEPPKPKAAEAIPGNQPSRVAFVAHSIREATDEHIGDCERCRRQPPSARIALAARVVVARRHSPARCYWKYSHPDLKGSTQSYKDLLRRLAESGVDNSRKRPPPAPAPASRERSKKRRHKSGTSKRSCELSTADAPVELGPASPAPALSPLRVIGNSPAKRTRSTGPPIDHAASPLMKHPRVMKRLL